MPDCRMTPQIYIVGAIALASFGGGFGAAWKIQNGLQAEGEVERAKQTYETSLESQRLAHRSQTEDDQRVIAAQNAAALRQRVLRDDADRLRSAYVGLSNDSSVALSSALESHDACIKSATAQDFVLSQCGERYSSLAQAASGHVSDIQTLTEAWPRCTAQGIK